MTLRCYRVLHCQASVWNMFCLTSVKDLVHIHLRLPILAAPTIQSYGSLWFSAASWSPLWLWCCKPALTSWAEWSGRIRFHRSTGLSPRHWESVTSQPWKRFFEGIPLLPHLWIFLVPSQYSPCWFWVLEVLEKSQASLWSICRKTTLFSFLICL